MKRHAASLSILHLAVSVHVLVLQPAPLPAQPPADIFADGFESSWVHRWDSHVGVTPLPFLDVQSALAGSTTALPVGGTNAKERALMVHYLGTGKSIDGQAREQLPFRAYFATCQTETEQPKTYVSLTL
ncbi:MAG: hypothetical protein AAGF23_02785, partial [Acidobacteriota bacterium]